MPPMRPRHARCLTRNVHMACAAAPATAMAPQTCRAFPRTANTLRQLRKAARRAARSPRRFVNMPAPKRSARSHRTPARHVSITRPLSHVTPWHAARKCTLFQGKFPEDALRTGEEGTKQPARSLTMKPAHGCSAHGSGGFRIEPARSRHQKKPSKKRRSVW